MKSAAADLTQVADEALEQAMRDSHPEPGRELTI
jgi:hypothetical protein